MATPAQGKHPPNVTAVIINEQERQERLKQAPPGGGGTGPGATVRSAIVPSVDSTEIAEEHAQEVSDQLTGRAALLCAKKLGVPYVWSTQTKKKITLDSAETICRKNPGLIYFDFDALEEFVGDSDESESDEVEYVEDPEIADLEDPNVMAQLERDAELEVDPNPSFLGPDPLANSEELSLEAPDPEKRHPRRTTRSRSHARARSQEQVQQIKEEVREETFGEPQAAAHRITETERRAWGGTLSTPGMQVYIHPKGIARVDVQGRVRLHTGIKGNVRTFRIQAMERPPVGGTVKNVTHTTVTGPQAKSPNPQAATRHMQANRPPDIPDIPVPSATDYDDGMDY